MRKALLVVILAGASAFAGTVSGSLSFSNTPLLRPEGESEPAVAVANDGTVAVTGLQWLFNPSFFGTHFWTGPFGATPTFQGLLDSGLRQPGKIVFGSGDADFDIGSNNTLHATTLMFFINPTFRTAQIGVSAVICPNVTSASFTLQNCTRHFVDRTESDRDWITSDGPHVYLSYHDSGNSTLIHVQRSDNVFPALAVDSTNSNLYAAFSEGHHIFFSMSSDQGVHWSPAVVVNVAPATTAIFPWIAAHAGTVNVAYYATTAASKNDASAVWNVYLAKTADNGASFAQSVVSNASNHTGVICTNGTGCVPGTRNLLDLFKVAINPVDGRAAVIYTDDTLTKDTAGNPLPQIVLAAQQ